MRPPGIQPSSQVLRSSNGPAMPDKATATVSTTHDDSLGKHLGTLILAAELRDIDERLEELGQKLEKILAENPVVSPPD